MRISPEHVIVESIVTRQGYQTSPSGPHWIKDLHSCISPYLLNSRRGREIHSVSRGAIGGGGVVSDKNLEKWIKYIYQNCMFCLNFTKNCCLNLISFFSVVQVTFVRHLQISHSFHWQASGHSTINGLPLRQEGVRNLARCKNRFRSRPLPG